MSNSNQSVHSANSDTPPWLFFLPSYLQPPKTKWELLEQLRQKYHLDDQGFSILVGSSMWATVRTQVATLHTFREQAGDVPERDLWKAVVFSRLQVKLKSPGPFDPPQEEIQKYINSIQSLCDYLESWDDVIDFVVSLDAAYFNTDPLGIKYVVDDILTSD